MAFLVSTLLWVPIPTAISQAPAVPVVDASDVFFASGEIPRIRILVKPEDIEKLKTDPRAYVKATVREGDGVPFESVALKLKGAAGSFREWEDRPALTLNMRKFHKRGHFHGLVKFHLNNSVQDETYLHELLCSEMFQKAGIPVPRVSYARVWLNDRDVGLYVLKEGFGRPFLKRSFANPTGNLYDGGFVQDIDAALEKDEGLGTDDRSDLQAIVEAASDPNLPSRMRKLEALIDMEQFLTFMAMERLTSHWDGYTDNANNYRVYFDPKRGKAIFLPHGMDQMFGEPGIGLFDHSDRIAASSIIQSDVFRKRYREKLEELLPLMAPADHLIRRIDAIDRRLSPVMKAMSPEQAAQRTTQVDELKERLVARAANLRKQLDAPEEPLQEFDGRGIAPLNSWSVEPECERAVLEEVFSDTGRKLLSIAMPDGEPCAASWRCRVFLGPGNYTLKAQARTDRVIKIDDTNESGVGVGISSSGREQHLHGTIGPKALSHRFEIREDRKRVEFVLELRARSGQVWFEQDSLQLIREASNKER